MTPESGQPVDSFDPRFKLFHELMARKVRDVLLISTPYDAWIMQEDGRLSERIVNEYRGLNLSHPPRLNWVSTVDLALAALEHTHYDLVIIMARAADREAYSIGEKIKKKKPQLRVALLTHRAPIDQQVRPSWKIPTVVDEIFVWSGNTDILLAMIKCAEDAWNINHDTAVAGIRVIILVEDSPAYISALLPILYKQLVIQAQTVMEEGLNEEHRLLAMRARPKVLIAGAYEEARQFFEKYEPFVLGVISDARIPRNGLLDGSAGVDLLMEIKQKRFDIPRLLCSAESGNASKAKEISAVFVDKNSPRILSDIRSFLTEYLGFGDFVFRNEDGSEIFRASNLLGLESRLKHITDEVFIRHCCRNDFSRWLFARSEIELASKVREINCDDFSCNESHRLFLISIIHERRMQRQKGVVVNFDPKSFDKDTEFFKISRGSLGGKARGLAFMSSLLHHYRQRLNRFEDVTITIPQTLVITTDVFDAMVETNRLKPMAQLDLPDAQIAKRFLLASFPEEITDKLRAYLSEVCHPLAVRSSSLLEDARFRAYAGLYKTYMLPNDHVDPACRLNQLIDAIKLVYASTYYEGPKAFARRVGHRIEEEKMAVIIHRLSGTQQGQYFYPTISGVAQSLNYYPFSTMRPEEGIATIALGLGKAVMGGERVLRFSPAHPQMLPQSANVKDTLKNAQWYFYAVEMGLKTCRTLGPRDDVTLVKREIADAEDEPGVHSLLSTYLPEEDRIRDAFVARGHRVLTFAKVLKYNFFPLAEILREILAMGQDAMGCPVEIEFSVEPDFSHMKRSSFSVLQIRPMSSLEDMTEVDIDETEIRCAVCLSAQALGNTTNRYLADIIYVKPDTFVPAKTMEIAREIGRVNAKLVREERKYLLVGPGRWGSADRWLGIPVTWSDICGVGAIIETAHLKLRAEPSQGSHFFHNMTSLGINYFTVFQEDRDRLNWQWLTSLPKTSESEFLAHVRLDSPLTLKVDGRRMLGVILSKS
jgi:hypothetical protein